MAVAGFLKGGACSNSGNDRVITLDTTGSDVIVVVILDDTNLTSVTDDQSNSYSVASGAAQTTYYVDTPTTNASHTITVAFSSAPSDFVFVFAMTDVDTSGAIVLDHFKAAASSALAENIASTDDAVLMVGTVDPALSSATITGLGSGQTDRTSDFQIGNIPTDSDGDEVFSIETGIGGSSDTQSFTVSGGFSNTLYIEGFVIAGGTSSGGSISSSANTSSTTSGELVEPPSSGDTLHILRQRLSTPNGNLPSTSWAAPGSGILQITVTNTDTKYSWDAPNNTVTLPSSDLADGYLMMLSIEIEDTSGGRHNFAGRIVQTVGTGNFVSAQTSGYNRDASEDRSYIRCFAFVDNPSASAEFQVQWKRDNDSPTGGVVACSFEVISMWYDNIGMYSSASTTQPATTTPTALTGWSSILESDTSAIELASNTFTIKSDNKRYLVLGSYYWEGNYTNRSQRLGGLDIDGTYQDHVQGYSYMRTANNNIIGEMFSWLVDRATTDIDLQLDVWKGPNTGSFPNYGCSVGGTATGSNPFHAMVILELPDDAEVFTTKNNSQQSLATAGTRVEVDISPSATFGINDSASFTRSDDNGINIEQDMDVLLGANITGGYATNSNARFTGYATFTIDGTDQDDTKSGDYGRGTSGTNTCYGWSANLISSLEVSEDQDVGVSAGKIAGGEAGTVAVLNGFAGMWGLNLQSIVPASTPSGDIDSSITTDSTVSGELSGVGELDSSVTTDSITSGDLTVGASIGTLESSVNTSTITTSVLSGKGSLSSTVATSSTVSGSIDAEAGMSSSVSTVSTITGSLTANGELQSLINTFSTPTGTATARADIASSVSTGSTVSGTLLSEAELAATVSTSSTTSGTLSATGELFTSVFTDSDVNGTLGSDGILEALVTTQTITSGTLGSKTDASSSINTSSTVTGTLSAEAGIDSSVTTDSTVNGSLIATGKLSTTINTSSSVEGVAISKVPVEASIATNSTVEGTLTVVASIESSVSTQSTVQGQLAQVIPIEGQINTGSTVQGYVLQTKEIESSVNTSSSVSGTLNGLTVLNASVNTNSTVNGNLDGNFDPVVQIASDVQTHTQIWGSLTGVGAPEIDCYFEVRYISEIYGVAYRETIQPVVYKDQVYPVSYIDSEYEVKYVDNQEQITYFCKP